MGDSAWCVSLYAGMGVSAGLAGADLLGTVLWRHPDDIPVALRSWESQLRPHITAYQEAGVSGRLLFTPDDQRRIALRPVIARDGRLNGWEGREAVAAAGEGHPPQTRPRR